MKGTVMRRIIILLTILLLPSVVVAWPWSQDMMNQPSIKPQEGEMYPFPKRSVPVFGIPTKVANRDAAKELKNPIGEGIHIVSQIYHPIEIIGFIEIRSW